jgi:hypothetical protein
MLRVRAAACLTATFAITLSQLAFAKSSLQGQAAVSLGWTDNVLSVPDVPTPPSTQVPQSDFYFQLRPSLIFTHGAARVVTRLSYTFNADLYATHSEANSYNHVVAWQGFFLTSKTTDLLLGASVSTGRLNAFNTAQAAGATPIVLVTPGGQNFVSTTFNEQFGWDATARWRFLQSLGVNSYSPIDPHSSPDTVQVENHLNLDRSWRFDAVGLDLRTALSVVTELRGPTGVEVGPTSVSVGTPIPVGALSPRQLVLINGLTLKWRHDFGRFWATELDGGVVEASRLEGRTTAIWQPAVLAALRYLHPYGQAELSYAHNVQPNPIVAQTFVIDAFALRLGVPLGQRTNLLLAGSAGYQLSRTVDFDTGGTTSTAHSILVDGSLGWTPRPEISLFLRYQLFDQIGEAGFTATQSLLRHTVMLGAIATWPAQAAAIVPSREALRVDRADAVNIPEQHSQPQKTP